MKRKIKKGQAILSAWTLVAAMGLTPVLSVAYPSGTALVYAKEMKRQEETEEDYTGKEDTDGGTGEEGLNYLQTATPSEALPEASKDSQPGKETEAPGLEEGAKREETEANPVDMATGKAELITATPSNAMMYKSVLDIWTGMEMSDHFDGEGTEEEPYEINSAKDLKLLAYNVANEQVDGYEGCYFILTRDVSLSDTASWLPVGYFTEAGDSEPKPFKGNFDGQGYRVYNLKISDTTQDYAGLFGSIHGAVIENLTVDGQVNARSKAAVLVGEANDSTIKNCSSKGQVRGVGVIGGIAGETYDRIIL